MRIRIAYTQPGDDMRPVATLCIIPEADLVVVLLDPVRAGAMDPDEGLAMWNRLYAHLDVADPQVRKPVPHLSLAV